MSPEQSASPCPVCSGKGEIVCAGCGGTGTATHVDRILTNPLSAPGKLLMRCPSLDDPRIGGQERDGWATYVYVTEPHTMRECEFDVEGNRR